MKEPKTFEWPRVYMRIPKKLAYRQEAGVECISEADRVRIIYPDGRIPEWSPGAFVQGSRCDEELVENSKDWTPHFGKVEPCWFEGGTAKEQVEQMKAYDAKYGYKTIFAGELKP